ncbi:hypothetical protein SMICM17S_03640 [Streptomyces microflavus]
MFHVPWVDWLSPIVQQLIHSPASPIHRAACRMSASGTPVIPATRAGWWSARKEGISSQPSVNSAMNSSSVCPFSTRR